MLGTTHRRRLPKFSALLAVAALLPACKPVWKENAWLGKSEAQVVASLGTPDWSTSLMLSRESRLLEHRGGLERLLNTDEAAPIEIKECGWERYFGTTAVWFTRAPHGEWQVADTLSWRKDVRF